MSGQGRRRIEAPTRARGPARGPSTAMDLFLALWRSSTLATASWACGTHAHTHAPMMMMISLSCVSNDGPTPAFAPALQVHTYSGEDPARARREKRCPPLNHRLSCGTRRSTAESRRVARRLQRIPCSLGTEVRGTTATARARCRLLSKYDVMRASSTAPRWRRSLVCAGCSSSPPAQHKMQTGPLGGYQREALQASSWPALRHSYDATPVTLRQGPLRG